MIYRSLKQGYKYELEVNVVIFSSFLGFFLFLLFREFFPQGGSNSSPEFLRSPVKTILNRSQGHRCRHRDPSISPEMLRSQFKNKHLLRNLPFFFCMEIGANARF